ncbi:MAG: rhomboid family intramembrane serine protease [Kiritimatiellia bacterium]|nr:rhomboid family intramembrane serine protease [Kiritimatiellia bacterium]
MDYYQTGGGFMRGMLTPAVRFLLIATGSAFLGQLIIDPLTGGRFTFLFSLSWAGIKHLLLWQFISYIFLHGGIFHIFLNMLGLFFFGPDVERTIGSKRFIVLYLVCGILGGIGWLLFTASQTAGFCLGASGAVFGILGAFAALFPERPITILVFFVLPVTMKARSLAIALAVFSLLATISQPGNIAYAAHLGGGLAGYFYILLFHSGKSGFIRPSIRQLANDLLWRWHRRKFKVMSGHSGLFEDDEEAPTTAAVNSVLEKVSREGIASLTRREHEILKRASRAGRVK